MDNLGEGNPEAPIWFLARDYGADEKKYKRPLVGAAGRLFNQSLMKAAFPINWDRQFPYLRDVPDWCYIDNLVPVQPLANQFELHEPEDLQWGEDRLRELLERFQPKLIVSMGNEVTKFLLGEQWPLNKRGQAEGIQNIRGYMWDTPFGRVLPTIHPAALLRDWVPWRVLLDMDMKKAKRELELGCPDFPIRQVKVITEIHEFQEVRNALRVADRWAVDIENDYELQLSCVGFAPSKDLAFVVPAGDSQRLAFIRELCTDPKPKILQNGQYDRMFLDYPKSIREDVGCDIELVNQTVDTMLQWHALQPELAGAEIKLRAKKKGGYSRRTQKSLRFLSSIFSRQPWFKDYSFETEMDKYQLNGLDCCVTFEVAEIMERMLK